MTYKILRYFVHKETGKPKVAWSSEVHNTSGRKAGEILEQQANENKHKQTVYPEGFYIVFQSGTNPDQFVSEPNVFYLLESGGKMVAFPEEIRQIS